MMSSKVPCFFSLQHYYGHCFVSSFLFAPVHQQVQGLRLEDLGLSPVRTVLETCNNGQIQEQDLSSLSNLSFLLLLS